MRNIIRFIISSKYTTTIIVNVVLEKYLRLKDISYNNPYPHINANYVHYQPIILSPKNLSEFRITLIHKC